MRGEQKGMIMITNKKDRIKREKIYFRRIS